MRRGLRKFSVESKQFYSFLIHFDGTRCYSRYSMDQRHDFSVATWNILANYYANPQFFDVPAKYLSPGFRKPVLLRDLTELNADILCLQEVDEYNEYWKYHLMKWGYESIWAKRSGKRLDGCVIAYKKQKFQLGWEYKVEYDELAQELSLEDIPDINRFKNQ